MTWLLALKRVLGRGRWIVLVVILGCTIAAGRIGFSVSLKPCGVVCEDTSASAARVLEMLINKGFVSYPSRAELSLAVETGEVDCGAVLLEGTGAGIDANALEGCVLMLRSPMSFMCEAYRASVQTSLYRASSPARILSAASEAGAALDEQDVREVLDEYYAAGPLFSFDIETSAGASAGSATASAAFASRLARAVCAVLIFAYIMTSMRLFRQESSRIACRIGRRRAASSILLPSAVILVISCTLAGVLGLVIGCEAGFGICLALLAYCLACALLGLGCSYLPGLVHSIALPVLLIGSLALYPVYLDLAEMISAGWIRYLFPPCWFSLFL